MDLMNKWNIGEGGEYKKVYELFFESVNTIKLSSSIHMFMKKNETLQYGKRKNFRSYDN